MKADAHKQVQYLRRGMEQFLVDEDKHIANGAPRLRGEQFPAAQSNNCCRWYELPQTAV